MRWSFIIVALFLFSFVSATIPDDCHEDMVAYWRFTENLVDSYGDNDGLGDNSYGVFESGRAASFSGSQSITISDDGVLDLSGSSGSTINFWFLKGTNAPQDGALISKGNSYSVEWIDEGPFGGGYLEATYKGVSVSTSDLSKDSAYFVSVVHNVSHLMIYVDGNLEDIVSHGSRLSISGEDLYFGVDFEGKLDEVAFYDAPLEVTPDISSAYARSSAGKDYCATSGGTSSGTRTDFTIDGCISGEESIFLGDCSRSGKYYCSDAGDLLSTLRDAGACTSGSCCPGGYECREAEDTDGPAYTPGLDYCFQRLIDCSDYDDETDCEDNSCFWIEDSSGEGFCSSSQGDFSCSFYQNQTSCEDDEWRLGTSGIGTDICGTFVETGVGVNYLISECQCSWDSSTSICSLYYEAKPTIHNGTVEGLTCEKVFSESECVDGEQLVQWTVDSDRMVSPGTLTSQDWDAILAASGCVAGSSTRSCGSTLVKLSFFSSFSFLFAVMIISGYYFFRKSL